MGFRRLPEAPLDVAHRVVAEITGEPASEAQGPGGWRGAKRLEVAVDEFERIVDHFLLVAAAIARDRDLAARDFEALAGGEPHDRVAPEARAADDRVQEVRAGT